MSWTHLLLPVAVDVALTPQQLPVIVAACWQQLVAELVLE